LRSHSQTFRDTCRYSRWNDLRVAGDHPLPETAWDRSYDRKEVVSWRVDQTQLLPKCRRCTSQSLRATLNIAADSKADSAVQQYHDPVTFKIFNDHTAIAAIKTSGNVYARESIDRLNIKPQNWNDLMTDEPFVKKDIIMLQDPLNIQAKDRQFSSGLITNRVAGTDQVPVSELIVSKFDYVRRNLEVQTEENALSGINVEASGIGRVLKSIADKEKKENDVSFSFIEADIDRSDTQH